MLNVCFLFVKSIALLGQGDKEKDRYYANCLNIIFYHFYCYYYFISCQKNKNKCKWLMEE